MGSYFKMYRPAWRPWLTWAALHAALTVAAPMPAP